MVPTKPRIASSKSCRLANGNVFAISALAFNVAGSGPLGATCPCAIEPPAAIVTVIAAVRSSHSDALKFFMLVLSLRSMWSQFFLREAIAVSTSLHESDVVVFQRHRTNALAGRRKNTLSTAGDATVFVGSPTPPQKPPLGITIVSTFGISPMRIELRWTTHNGPPLPAPPPLAQMRSANRIEECLSLEAKRKTSARIEYFAF
jgi:hypothetical protein